MVQESLGVSEINYIVFPKCHVRYMYIYVCTTCMQDRTLAANLTYPGRYFHYDFVLNWLRKKASMLSCTKPCHKQVHTSLSQKTQSLLWYLSSKYVCVSGGMLSVVIPCMFRQALSPVGLVTEWVQWHNTIQNSKAAVNRNSSRAVKNKAQMYDRLYKLTRKRKRKKSNSTCFKILLTSCFITTLLKWKVLLYGNHIFQVFIVSWQENSELNIYNIYDSICRFDKNNNKQKKMSSVLFSQPSGFSW